MVLYFLASIHVKMIATLGLFREYCIQPTKYTHKQLQHNYQRQQYFSGHKAMT